MGNPLSPVIARIVLDDLLEERPKSINTETNNNNKDVDDILEFPEYKNNTEIPDIEEIHEIPQIEKIEIAKKDIIYYCHNKINTLSHYHIKEKIYKAVIEKERSFCNSR